MCTSSIRKDIHTLWEMESDVQTLETKPISFDEKKVLQLWEDNLRLVDGKFELPIPWKSNGPQFPNSYLAYMLIEDLKVYSSRQIDEQIDMLLQNGFAEYVPDDEINLCDETVWFLPHHHVSKKSGKLRIVHDCAFEVNGVSLNKSCY